MTLTATEIETPLMADYPEPVNRLLTHGETRICRKPGEWPDYVGQYGFTLNHAPHLIRMATDKALLNLITDDPAVYGPVHAWRTLGQLKAIEAVEPLLTLLTDDHDDWMGEELPVVLGLIGPAGIPAIQAYLSDSAYPEHTRISALDSLSYIREFYPESTAQYVEIVREQLATRESAAEGLNGFLIGALIEEKVLEAVPLIEQVFAEEKVDEMVCGPLEDVLVDIGAKEATPEYLAQKERRAEEARARFDRVFQAMLTDDQRQKETAKIQRQLAKTIKTKRKQQKQARKQNRRK